MLWKQMISPYTNAVENGIILLEIILRRAKQMCIAKRVACVEHVIIYTIIQPLRA